MFKKIIKEAGISILLLIAITLILGIIFYDYIPNNKTIPAKVELYNFPEDIKEELNTTLKEQEIVRTYYIDNSDLNLYESTKDYDKGKVNPFVDADDKKTPTSTNNTSGNNTSSGNGNSTGNSNTTSQNNTTTSQTDASKGTFFNKTGKY